MPFGYGDVDPECLSGVPGSTLVSGEEDLERLCLGNNPESTLEQGDTDLLCLGGVPDVTLEGLGEEEPEWLRLGDITVFILGCGDDDLHGLCLGGVLDFI
ncbi:hypothetical protein I79_022431 [Cricetulus griseus]|uniref:Uncharacterized protein n=1 Tax=Cricetulus griseus TaxID=10029 RepID=G3IFB1_CRIGR|nr:hypothetical protein I79_022431 [Cricetulus griseus]